MGARVVTVNDVLDGHVALDIQCLDRIYLNAYVPKLQSSAQVVAFLSDAMKERASAPRDVPRHSRGAHFYDEGGPCEQSLRR
jgi:hypothetical protein